MSHHEDRTKAKKYGQFFSGKLVSELLTSMIPCNSAIKSIIDPMVGIGDLLKAAHNRFSRATEIRGIDIDPDIATSCRKNIPSAKILTNDAFKSKEINLSTGWDLVITNPPYIRYQTLKSNPVIGLPDGDEIRNSLIKDISNSNILSEQDKKLYLSIAKKYSGLSDMVIPSWILCASIVKQGGYLAMVVPETWLNRNYAVPIHYLLLRCFEVIAIARDAESSWFNKAEVKTCLVVCRRKKNEALKKNKTKTILIDISTCLRSEDSLIGNLQYAHSSGYKALHHIISKKAIIENSGIKTSVLPTLEFFSMSLKELSNQEWICSEDKLHSNKPSIFPNEIKDIIKRYTDIEYTSLASLGWAVGQGLRTGANDFFYAKICSEKPTTIIQTASWHKKKFTLSSDNYRKAIKKRSDISGLVVDYKSLRNCIIYIQNQVRSADYLKLSKKARTKFSLTSPSLDNYISEADRYVSPKHGKPFKELSAVVTNEKKTKSGFERFWYMLPPLKDRHHPNLCIPRVCSESPATLFIKQTTTKEIIVDANFITLWHANPSSQLKMFALLNSTWAKAFLELLGITMGGGALKIESTHIYKIVFPKIHPNHSDALEAIGKSIVKSRHISAKLQDQIDKLVLSSFGSENFSLINNQLKELISQKIQERAGLKNDK